MCDCTSSMASQIRTIRLQITTVAQQYAKMYDQACLMVVFLGYRDFDVKPQQRFELFEFDGNISNFVDFMSNVVAEGGDDAAEDNAGALQEAALMNWGVAGEKSTKIVIHIADAPAHGSAYSGRAGDKFPNKVPDVPVASIRGKNGEFTPGRANTLDCAASLQELYHLGIKTSFTIITIQG